MLRITSAAYHEKLTMPQEEIILNGPPNDLRGRITINNEHDDVLKIKSLPINHGKDLVTLMGNSNSIKLSCKLNIGEQKVADVWHQVPSFTKPGTYESSIQIGGQERKVKMIIQSQIEIDIQPTTFTFLGTEPGTVHTCEFTLTNLGNIPFQVPDVKHVATLDMDMLCRAFGMAMRGPGEGGYEQVLNDIAKNVQSNLPDWANAQVIESGTILQPGDIQLIHVHIAIPKNCKANQDYNGNMRFWDKDIAYFIKSHQLKSR